MNQHNKRVKPKKLC